MAAGVTMGSKKPMSQSLLAMSSRPLLRAVRHELHVHVPGGQVEVQKNEEHELKHGDPSRSKGLTIWSSPST